MLMLDVSNSFPDLTFPQTVIGFSLLSILIASPTEHSGLSGGSGGTLKMWPCFDDSGTGPLTVTEGYEDFSYNQEERKRLWSCCSNK